MQQGLANATLLATPVFLAAANTREHMSPVEVCGWLIWLASWAFENAADVSKLMFLDECKTKAKAIAADTALSAAQKESAKKEIQLGCLGMAPFAGPKYRMWTMCRHPNYFGEWGCWLGLVVSAVPSLFAVCGNGSYGWWLVPAMGVMLLYDLRLFYDCLVWWTGAGPAEHFSGLKRPLYLEYQRSTRCFWPSFIPSLPGMDHHQEAGWPHAEQ
jgi:steroid 5-alpha reductase family enzyme